MVTRQSGKYYEPATASCIYTSTATLLESAANGTHTREAVRTQLLLEH